MKFYTFVLIILLFLFLFSTETLIPAQHPTSELNINVHQETVDDWYKQPQIYAMVALPPDKIKKYHTTVNGLWNGFIGENFSSPFALGMLVESIFSGRTYSSDKEFVDTQHDQGMLVPGTILTTQGHRSFQQDDFEEFACRSVNGELCLWDAESDSYWMNALYPGFIDWCINHGKKAIDAGADIIVLDEIQGNSLIPLYQWSSQYTGIPAPGFSSETIEAFRVYLVETYTSQELSNFFEIEDIETAKLKDRIGQTMNLSYLDRIQADALIEDYQLFLEQSNFEAKKRLIQSLRDYAEEKNKSLVISANSFALGTPQSFGFWAKGLIFADLIDLFTFENTYTAVFDQTIPDFYQTKWLAWHRLAYAATGAPAVSLIDTQTLKAVNENMFPLLGFSHSLGILCAESFANKGSFVNYHFPVFNRERNWNDVQKIHEFVTDNCDLYDYSAESYGDVSLLFLYSKGMREHMNTYLGCAQALAESHIPFEVVFDGDGMYLNASLSFEDIKDYPVLIIPSLLKITPEQKNVIKTYVQEGGVALIFDAEEMDLDDFTGEVSYGNGLFYIFKEDLAKKYFETYDDSYRRLLADTISSYSDISLLINNNDRKIIATPYYQNDNNRVILHLVNYDHIGFFDFIWPHSNIQIELTYPSFLVESIHIKYMDDSIEKLDFEYDQDYIYFTVPFLKDYAVVIID
ncbi:MAG TPA: hypothetical protein VKP59_05725 [Candidatus Thermoplasmatota archaeon]|nr:hypothetical protein [Candidatus Thermoplasmatota archaeon]